MKKSLIFLASLFCLILAAGNAQAAAKVKLTVWGMDPPDAQADHLYLRALVKGFSAKYPDIQLEYVPLGNDGLKNKTKVSMAAGNVAADIVQSWGGSVVGGYADAGRLLDMTAELSSVPGSPAAQKAMSWKGKIYGVAPFFAIAGVFVNEGILKANGLQAPTTIEELEKVADALKAKGIQPFTCGAKDKWPALATYMYLVNRYGGDAFDQAQSRKIRFDSEAFVKAGEKYQEWVRKGFFGDKPLGAAYGDAQQQMATGKAAMHITGSWMNGQYSDKKFTDQTLGFYAFPVLTGGKGKATDLMGMTDVGYIATKHGADKKDAVVKFMKYAMSAEAAAAEPGRISSVPGVKPPSRMTGMAAAIFAKAESVQFWWDQDLPPAVTSPLNDTIQKFFLPDTSVKAEMTKFEGLMEQNVGPAK